MSLQGVIATFVGERCLPAVDDMTNLNPHHPKRRDGSSEERLAAMIDEWATRVPGTPPD